MQSARNSCPTLTKFGISQQSFIKVSNTKVYSNPSYERGAEAFAKDRLRNKGADVAKLIGPFRNYAKVPKHTLYT
jgi:hypothetical protein